MKDDSNQVDPEIAAITAVYSALRQLEPDAQGRVLSYVAAKLKVSYQETEGATTRENAGSIVHQSQPRQTPEPRADENGDLDGISPIARKWLTRNGISVQGLGAIFSLGVEEIDLIAKAVPGKTKKDKLRSVFLLRGIAAYLGSGAARFTHEQVKETALHYDAFDAANFAVIFKSLAAEISGSKDAGYTLSARGLASATEMVKSMATN